MQFRCVHLIGALSQADDGPDHDIMGAASLRSEDGRLAMCPPVVEYGREFQTRAADELVLLPKGAAIAEMLADYGVMRKQALSCR
ncbi:hypothetical protein [Phaeobacter italicus]|uniref:hypothetical protein n=1 Tax=Phaeobacter italicus TaxID=481446 RepID=UPI00248E688B|nr:hypothetical protein [Phaeobacter italicus]